MVLMGHVDIVAASDVIASSCALYSGADVPYWFVSAYQTTAGAETRRVHRAGGAMGGTCNAPMHCL